MGPQTRGAPPASQQVIFLAQSNHDLIYDAFTQYCISADLEIWNIIVIPFLQAEREDPDKEQASETRGGEGGTGAVLERRVLYR